MDEVIWVEVLSRHQSVLARHRCTGRGIRIGRAYTNDVVLDDPYVAPEHAQIVRDEDGRLLVEDLGTANGLFAARGSKRLERLALADDSVFRVGQTFLRIRELGHKVEPEREMGVRVHTLAAIAALLVAVVAGEALSLWLGDFSEPEAATYLVPLVGGSAIVAVWTALWSVIARVFSGHARFEENLIIALAGALGIELVTTVNAWGAFSFSWSMLKSYSLPDYLTVGALMCFFHLRLINPARSLAAGGVLALLLAAGVGIEFTVERDFRPGVSQLYVRNILPPELRIMPVESETSFFDRVVKLRSQLDKDRAETP